jgi:hypothetical protein
MRRIVAILALFILSATAQAASNLGSGGLGFSCDVNTRKCTCSGVWDGADCEAMKKNCKDKTTPAGCNASEGWCICNMAIKTHKNLNVVPLDKNKVVQPQ